MPERSASDRTTGRATGRATDRGGRRTAAPKGSGGAGKGVRSDAEPEAPVCSVPFCPICTAVMATQKAGPEAMGHLILAAREMLLAARAVLEVRTPDVPEKGPQRVQRIEIK